MSENEATENMTSNSLPRGKYTLIGIDIDTTGRRLIDEIVQLSAYCPTAESQYSQYIMPYMNLNPAARQRHQVRVITIGFFRMLKSMQTYKVVKTKSEIAALMDFLAWIEKIKESDPNSNGIIFIYHEQRKFIPYMILEAFNKYNLLPRLLLTVCSFANGYEFAEAKCSNTVKYLNLRELSKVLLNKEEEKNRNYFEGNASVRARLAFEIAEHLAKGEQKNLENDGEIDNMLEVFFAYSHPVSKEIAELTNQRNILNRQNSLRPIFLQYFKSTLYHRVRAVTYRRVLAEKDLDFDTLNKIWMDKKKEGIASEIEKLVELKDTDKTDLVDILDSYFDPEKTPSKPSTKRQKTPRKRTKRGVRKESNENIKTKDNDKTTSATPDSTSKTPTKRNKDSPKKNQNSLKKDTTPEKENIETPAKVNEEKEVIKNENIIEEENPEKQSATLEETETEFELNLETEDADANTKIECEPNNNIPDDISNKIAHEQNVPVIEAI